jgi:hypothetical protein
VGFFGTYLLTEGQWLTLEAGQQIVATEPWIQVAIHDSDFTIVDYRPAGSGSGECYLGSTPRTYFEDDNASAATDRQREAAGLAEWWSLAQSGATPAQVSAKRDDLLGFLAEDLEPDEDEEEDDELPDEEIFVEIKTGIFLTALGLSLPADLVR